MDRQFMIIDEKSNFVTGRQYPKLSLIQVIPRSNGFILKANGMDDFYLDLPISESSSKELVQTMVCMGGYVDQKLMNKTREILALKKVSKILTSLQISSIHVIST